MKNALIIIYLKLYVLHNQQKKLMIGGQLFSDYFQWLELELEVMEIKMCECLRDSVPLYHYAVNNV